MSPWVFLQIFARKTFDGSHPFAQEKAPMLPLKTTATPILLWLVTAMIGASQNAPIVHQPPNFQIKGEQLLLDGKEFRIRAISFEPFMPGETPGIHSPKKLDYVYGLAKTREANANAVYLLTGDPDNLQPAFFQRAKAEGLPIILGLWFSGEANDYNGHTGDFQDPAFKEYVRSLIRRLVDKYHGLGGADYSPQIIYVSLGNEFFEATVEQTNNRHRVITSYQGKYVSVPKGTQTDCFLAEMMDYYKTYEAERYQQSHYVSHHTWPVVSPRLL